MGTVTVDPEVIVECEAYIGRSREVSDTMAPEAAEKLSVIFGIDAPLKELPPTWHWAYFNKGIPSERIGHDAHEQLGHFLPPAPFDRRMWAAGDVTMHRPLKLGQSATRNSTIKDVTFKSGSTGDLCFVNVEHEISQGGELCIVEIQTIVYRDRGLADKALRGPDDPVPDGYFVNPDFKLLFYSAVTHNGHRIHWDRDFCRDVEGYPGLVVHGPMMATELCDALRDGNTPCRFSFRATAPVFESSPIRIIADAPSNSRDGTIERSDETVSMKGSWSRL